MGGSQAADVLATVKQDQLARQGKEKMSDEELEKFRAPTLEKYEREGSPCLSCGRSAHFFSIREVFATVVFERVATKREIGKYQQK